MIKLVVFALWMAFWTEQTFSMLILTYEGQFSLFLTIFKSVQSWKIRQVVKDNNCLLQWTQSDVKSAHHTEDDSAPAGPLAAAELRVKMQEEVHSLPGPGSAARVEAWEAWSGPTGPPLSPTVSPWDPESGTELGPAQRIPPLTSYPL